MPKNLLLKKEVDKLKGEISSKDKRIADLESQLASVLKSNVQLLQQPCEADAEAEAEADLTEPGVEVEVVLATSCVDELSAKDKTIRELTKKTEDLETRINKNQNTPHHKRWWLF
jgi:prefoldin subunit 5